jgi:hypothetical protein
MISWILKIKKNKVLFALVIAVATVLLFDLVAVAINVVQMIKTSSNAASLMQNFFTFNIAVIAINAFMALVIAVYLILKRYTKLKV